MCDVEDVISNVGNDVGRYGYCGRLMFWVVVVFFCICDLKFDWVGGYLFIFGSLVGLFFF